MLEVPGQNSNDFHFDVSRILEPSKHGLTGGGFSSKAPPMDEIKYRESRVCRLLGNPVVYQLVLFFGERRSVNAKQAR
jgi:hypothetical protein